MADAPVLTMVTPAYNQGRYLAETIDSVLAQDVPLEYQVIDDGSKDETPDVMARYAGRIQGERQANMGQVRTLNKGWGRANGKYLAYLSSDDVLYPGALRKLVDRLEADPSLACVFPDCDLIDDRSKVIKRNVCRPFDLAQLVVEQECYIGPGAVFRRDAFEAVGGWRPELRLAPDREFWMRLATRGRIEFVPETLAGYRFHPQSLSYKEVSEEQSREYLLVLDGYFARPDVPPAIRAREDEAYGHAHLLLARNRFRSGDWRRGRQLYAEAVQLHPPLAATRYKLRLLRNVASKPARAAAAKLRSVFRG
ncbi:glycosyltransferase [Ramlibacter algicola]|uniref:Glycosyltransferase n=1 Tax=Ramlibacter algicola TaxID=2795217 RepID=A0A934UQB7_9BURK|nr:glycosyltransferase [Ramlibacter algicola]MBK0391945.1 glycosyltransferase [Ramlibacter algicola]